MQYLLFVEDLERNEYAVVDVSETSINKLAAQEQDYCYFDHFEDVYSDHSHNEDQNLIHDEEGLRRFRCGAARPKCYFGVTNGQPQHSELTLYVFVVQSRTQRPVVLFFRKARFAASRDLLELQLVPYRIQPR